MKLTELYKKLTDLKDEVKLLKAQYDDARQSWNDREASLVQELNLLKGRRARPDLKPIDKKALGKEIHEMQKFSLDERTNLKIIQAKPKSPIQKLADDINNHINNEQWRQDNDN